MRLSQSTVICLFGLLLLVAGRLSGQAKCKFNCDELSCVSALKKMDKETVQTCGRFLDEMGIEKPCPYLFYTDAGADGWVPTGSAMFKFQYMKDCTSICPPVTMPGGGYFSGKAKLCTKADGDSVVFQCAAKCAPAGS